MKLNPLSPCVLFLLNGTSNCLMFDILYLVVLSTVLMLSLSARYCGSFSFNVLYTIVMSL